jgi:hypothetical protein
MRCDDTYTWYGIMSVRPFCAKSKVGQYADVGSKSLAVRVQAAPGDGFFLAGSLMSESVVESL